MAVNYVLKNPVHHGQTNTPYSYKYSSANYLFAGERGIPTPRLMAHHTNHMRFIGPMAVAARCSIIQSSELKKALGNAIGG